MITLVGIMNIMRTTAPKAMSMPNRIAPNASQTAAVSKI
jgi:hypothetical protein